MVSLADNLSNINQGTLQSFSKQSRGDQDFVITGSCDDYDWIVVCDGHGKRLVSDHIRTLNWKSLIERDTFFEDLGKEIINLGDTANSGTTFSVVKIYSDRYECYWVGDSTIKILIYYIKKYYIKIKFKYLN